MKCLINVEISSCLVFPHKYPNMYLARSRFHLDNNAVFAVMLWIHSLIISKIAAVWWRINVAISFHDNVIKWNHFPRYWPFVRGIHRSPVNSPLIGQWLGSLMFSLICAWINHWVNNDEAGDLRRHRGHYDVTVILGRISAPGAHSSLGTSQSASDTGNVNQ